MSQDSFDPESFAREIPQIKGPAPVDKWDPPFCGDIDMRIASDGSWYYQGSPIRRQAMVRLFSSILRRDDDGCHYLVTPVEKLRIRVDDCPFTAVLLDVSGSGRDTELSFTLNTGEEVLAGPDNPLNVDERDGEPHPRLLVRGGLEALLARNVFYQLVAISQPSDSDESLMGVWSRGGFFPLGRV